MKRMKKLASVVLAILCLAGALAGCGSKKPTEKDAKAYVKAVLDIICTGDYDHSVKFADLNATEAKQTRKELLDSVEESLTGSGDIELPEETIKHFHDVMDKALQKCRYTVDEAVAAGDGYDVTVTIEPLVVMESAKISDNLMSYLLSSPGVASLSQEQITVAAMDYVIDCIEENLAEPVYASPEKITVHYGPLQGDTYGVSEADGERVGSKLFVVN